MGDIGKSKEIFDQHKHLIKICIEILKSNMLSNPIERNLYYNKKVCKIKK